MLSNEHKKIMLWRRSSGDLFCAYLFWSVWQAGKVSVRLKLLFCNRGVKNCNIFQIGHTATERFYGILLVFWFFVLHLDCMYLLVLLVPQFWHLYSKYSYYPYLYRFCSFKSGHTLTASWINWNASSLLQVRQVKALNAKATVGQPESNSPLNMNCDCLERRCGKWKG